MSKIENLCKPPLIEFLAAHDQNWFQVRGEFRLYIGCFKNFQYWQDNKYITAEEFIESISNPETKKAFLFNLDLWT